MHNPTERMRCRHVFTCVHLNTIVLLGLLFRKGATVAYSNNMAILLLVFGLGAAVELLLGVVPAVWRMRKAAAIMALALAGFGGGALVVWHTTLFSALIAWVGLFRAFNAIRVVEGRMHEAYLRRAARRTSFVLMGVQIVLTLLGWLWEQFHTTGHLTWTIVTAVQAATAVVLLVSTLRRLRRTAWPVRTAHMTTEGLPTLTVAVPARNETEDLEQCLQSLVASDYPKLEVIVLDDCSQTRRTPEIIRSFAHDGVRFVQGEEPHGSWLPKNQAYDTLARQASGEYILFCGVDVRFNPGALRQVVSTLLGKRKLMMSILPERAHEARSRTALAQAMRYCWELVPPRRLFRRPPVLSSCWIIKKDALDSAGGFGAVSRSIVPEAHFARMLTKTDAYSFMRAGRNPGIASVKSVSEQRATAIRMRYPQMHRRPENVLLLSWAEILFLLAPFGIASIGPFLHVGLLAIVGAAAAAVLLSVTYMLVALNTKVNVPWFSAVALPAVIIYDIGMLHYSMWQYEFSEVQWKGRNICVPAMHVFPHLPEV